MYLGRVVGVGTNYDRDFIVYAVSGRSEGSKARVARVFEEDGFTRVNIGPLDPDNITDEQRRMHGGFGPYECKQCHSMRCSAHESVCSLCGIKNREEEKSPKKWGRKYAPAIARPGRRNSATISDRAIVS